MTVPSRGSDQFQLRLPDGLRPRIAHLAKRNLRSMNSEIVFLLEKAIRAECESEKKLAPESAGTLSGA